MAENGKIDSRPPTQLQSYVVCLYSIYIQQWQRTATAAIYLRIWKMVCWLSLSSFRVFSLFLSFFSLKSFFFLELVHANKFIFERSKYVHNVQICRVEVETGSKVLKYMKTKESVLFEKMVKTECLPEENGYNYSSSSMMLVFSLFGDCLCFWLCTIYMYCKCAIYFCWAAAAFAFLSDRLRRRLQLLHRVVVFYGFNSWLRCYSFFISFTSRSFFPSFLVISIDGWFPFCVYVNALYFHHLLNILVFFSSFLWMFEWGALNVLTRKGKKINQQYSIFFCFLSTVFSQRSESWRNFFW